MDHGKDPRRIIETRNAKASERAGLNQLLDEVAEVLSPERVGFTSRRVSVARRGDRIYDTAPLVAKRGLVNATGAMLRPKSSAPGKWFDMLPEDEDLLAQADVKEWINFAENRQWKALYNPRAKFIGATGETDDDMVTFGTGCLYIGERADLRGLLFRSFHMAQVLVETDSHNDPLAIYITEYLTARQAADRWGRENLGGRTREILDRPHLHGADAEKTLDFIWCVCPRHDRDPRNATSAHMPFASYVVDVDSEHLVIEEGYEEFPFALARWDTRSGEVYGRGPGVLALPDVATLQQMGKTMLRALHRSVDPPWLLPSDSMVSAPKIKPGGVSYYDAKAVKSLGLNNPFMQMDSRANIPWGLNAQQALRESIFAVFYRNVLNLPIDAPQMTATEVIQRREEFVREIGAVFGRLESDYTRPIVERSFAIMMRRGAFGRPDQIPEALQGSEISFRFASPVEKAKRQIEEAAVTQAIDKVLAIGQIQPEVMDAYNWTELGKFIAESADMPPDLTLADNEIAEIQARRAKAAQAEQAMAAAERASNVAGALPPAMLERVG